MGGHSKQRASKSEKKAVFDKLSDKTNSILAADSNRITLYDYVSAAGAVCMLFAALVIPSNGIVKLLSFAIPYFLLSYKVLISDIGHILSFDFFNYRLIFTVASLCAFFIEKYSEAVLIMLMCRICDFIGFFIDGRAKSALSELRDLAPRSAVVETVDGYASIDVSEVRIGNRVVVEAGRRIPLDGIVIEGNSYVDSYPMGRCASVSAFKGTKVYAGCKNHGDTIVIKTVSNYSDTLVATALKQVESGIVEKTDLLEKIGAVSFYLSPVLFALAVLLAVYPSVKDGNWAEWIYRSLPLLIVSGLTLKFSEYSFIFFSGICRAAKDGVIFPGTKVMDTLSKVDSYIICKTGIITELKYKYEESFPLGLSKEVLINFAAKAEANCTHLLADALRSQADPLFMKSAIVSHFEELPGFGVKAVVNGARVSVGSYEFISEQCSDITVPGKGGTTVFVAINGRFRGSIVFSSKVRPGMFDVLEALRVLNAKLLVMLTGDVQSDSRKVAASMNFDMVKSELVPEDKLSSVEYLMNNKNNDSYIAFVGHKATDYELMQTADVGISVNSTDCENVFSDGEIVIIDDSIAKLPPAVKLSINTIKLSKQNLIIIVCLETLAIIAGLFGNIGILISFLLLTLSVVVPALNSLRLYYDRLL